MTKHKPYEKPSVRAATPHERQQAGEPWNDETLLSLRDREAALHVYQLAEAAWQRKLKAQPWREISAMKDGFILGFVNGYYQRSEESGPAGQPV